MRRSFLACLLLCCLTACLCAPALAGDQAAVPRTPDLPIGDQGEHATERARQAAEAEAEQLRQAVEEAWAAAVEARRTDAVWGEVFRQSESALDAVQIKADSLSRQLDAVIRPLRANLPEMEESARRLGAFSEIQRGEPLMLETILRRGESLAANLRRQMQPLTEARDLIADLSATVEQARRNLPDTGEGAQGAGLPEGIYSLEAGLAAMTNRLNRPLDRALRLADRLDSLRGDTLAVLPKAWLDHYLAAPSRFFDPAAWQDMGARFSRIMRNATLRLSVEVPRSATAWQGVVLRALNVLLIGGAALFFVNRRLCRNRARLGDEPDLARRGIMRGLFWVLLGLAVLCASIGSRSEIYWALLVSGGLIAMWGEVALAWDVRCLILNRRAGTSPLWPLYALPAVGILFSFSNLPGAVLSLCWLAAGFTALRLDGGTWRGRFPAVEDKLLHSHRLMLWFSLAVAVFGWPRMAVLLVVIVDCLLISIQLGMGLMQIVNRAADTGRRVVSADEHARHSLAAGLFAAFTAPAVLALVIAGMALWVIAMPGGALLLWHYLATGVSIGSASFNVLHLLLIISLFYVVRATIATLQSLMDRLASHSRLSGNLIAPMRTGITYGLWTVFGLFTLNALGFSLENLAIIAGGLSVGIGFGLQNIVNNFLSGLILIFSRTLHEGDVIDVGSLQGTVRKINVRATTIETPDNAV
ncbi:MAG: mechanosensitive ion channel, partial [Deltaproteobacteria bacterium]|nr:mechanosensitive ion channel [Deltaproteobacteria bacterium]